ncbi:MAG: hypothetical protein Q7S65_02935 [Nanoarchaeota archaeon]|nr:hypothetical protein [Nanoarchaeota archaeon]
MTFADELIARVSAHLDALRGLKPLEIKAVIKELKKEKAVWALLPSGNQAYLENALKSSNDEYLLGAIPHLVRALPHRLGFIASQAGHQAIGDPIFDGIITGRLRLEQLNPQQLVKFITEFHKSKKLSSAEQDSWFSGHRKTIATWLETYERKRTKSASEAEAYIAEKREKIINLFTKAILPNLMGRIARGEI